MILSGEKYQVILEIYSGSYYDISMEETNMMKACIFDLDGTLTDTLESLTYSVQAALDEMGLGKITEEQCRSFVGNGARYLMDRALRAAGDENGERLQEGMQVYGRIFDENCTYHVTPYEGILPMLQELKYRGLKLAVLSNKPHLQTCKVVREIFGEQMFDYASGQQEAIRRKPDPEGIFHILERLGVSKEECLYVGDSEVDIKTGLNGGLRTVGVTWGFRTKEELKAAGAGELIHHPMELLQFV